MIENSFYLFFVLFAFLLCSLVVSFGITNRAFRNHKQLSLIELVFLSMFMSSSLLVVLNFVLNFFGLRLSTGLIVTILIMLFLGNLALVKQEWANITSRNILAKRDYALLFCAAVIVAARVISVANFLVPPLSDPISHTEWLKYISQTGFTTNAVWYPQGLEYYLREFTALGFMNWAKDILIFTNLFLALIPISLYLFWRLIDKGGQLVPFITMVLASILAFPNTLFMTAGKNSMLFAFAIVPICLYFILSERNDYFTQIIRSVLMFSLFLIHYPTGAVLYVIFGANFIYRAGLDYKKVGLLQIFLDQFVLILISLPLLIALMIHALPLYKLVPPGSDPSMTSFILLIKTGGWFWFSTNGFYMRLIGLYGKFSSFLLVLLAMSVGSLVYLRENYFYKKGVLLIIGYCSAYLLLVVTIHFDHVIGAFMDVEMQYFLFFMMTVLISWFLGEMFSLYAKLPSVKLVIFCTLAIVFLYGNWVTFSEFYNFNKASIAVTKNDIKAFEKISSLKIPIQDKILTQMSNDATFITQTDGGSWLQVYTNNDAEVDFSEYTKASANDEYHLYIDLGSKKTEQTGLRDLSCKYGIKYIYWGDKQLYGMKVPKVAFDGNPNLKKVFDFGPTLYHVEGIACSN